MVASHSGLRGAWQADEAPLDDTHTREGTGITADHFVGGAPVHESMTRKLLAARRALEVSISLVLFGAKVGNNALHIALDKRAVAPLLVLEETGCTLAHDIDTPLRQLLAWCC